MGKKGKAGQRKAALKQAKKNAAKSSRNHQEKQGISKPAHKKAQQHAGGAASAERKDASCSAPAGLPRCPYESHQRTLLLGEGDFSFAAALCCLWGDASNLIATAYDDEAACKFKYAKLTDHVEVIRAAGGRVFFGVDAAQCHRHGTLRNEPAFDRIIFNFPHAGAGIKDQKRNVETNQVLLRGSFTAAAQLLAAGGQFHVTLKRGQPYDSWGAVLIARMAGLRVASCSTFVAAAFPGYAHRRTLGDEHAGDAGASPNAEVASAKTYAFVSAEEFKEAKAEMEQRKEGKKSCATGKAISKKTPYGVRKM